MPPSDRRLILSSSLWPIGFHPAGWRLAESVTEGTVDQAQLQYHARLLEAAKLDWVFIGDFNVCDYDYRYREIGMVQRPEALILASNLAATTTKIGVAPTVNASFSQPYTVARSLATLDHLSGGRALLNIVTGSSGKEALNYGEQVHWDTDRRFDHAEEYVTVLKQLWDSWEDGAVIADKARGELVDWNKIHTIKFRGSHFNVEGPLNVRRPTQGQIPILNAGVSQRALEFGAKYSDIRFTSSWNLEHGKRDYADIKNAARKAGKSHHEHLVVPGLAVYVGSTREEAFALYNKLQDLTLVTTDWQWLEKRFRISARKYDEATPVAQIAELFDGKGAPLPEVVFARQNYGLKDITLRQFFLSEIRLVGQAAVVGTPSDIADYIEEWFTAEAADGFNFFPPYHHGVMEAIAGEIVPELQRRGLFQKEYAPGTIRERIGLERPKNVFATK